MTLIKLARYGKEPDPQVTKISDLVTRKKKKKTMFKLVDLVFHHSQLRDQIKLDSNDTGIDG